MIKRAGDVAARFGLHPDTIRDWTDQFEEFFSSGARRGAGVRRAFTDTDEVVINTINELRKNRVDFEEIRARLAAGERMNIIPAANEPLPQESALAVYAELRELRVQISERDAEIERLRAENRRDREGLQSRIEKLLQEMAVFKYRLEQWEKSDDD